MHTSRGLVRIAGSAQVNGTNFQGGSSVLYEETEWQFPGGIDGNVAMAKKKGGISPAFPFLFLQTDDQMS
jgi:hypothetical protein